MMLGQKPVGISDRPKIYQIAQHTLKNVAICPAAFSIVEKMKERLLIRVSKYFLRCILNCESWGYSCREFPFQTSRF